MNANNTFRRACSGVTYTVVAVVVIAASSSQSSSSYSLRRVFQKTLNQILGERVGKLKMERRVKSSSRRRRRRHGKVERGARDAHDTARFFSSFTRIISRQASEVQPVWCRGGGGAAVVERLFKFTRTSINTLSQQLYIYTYTAL